MKKLIRENKKMILFFLILFIAMGGMCCLLYEPLMQLLKDGPEFRKYLQGFGLFGYVVMCLIVSLQVVFVFLPGEIVEVMSGYVYGTWGGLLACIIGTIIGTVIIFILVRFLKQNIFKNKDDQQVNIYNKYKKLDLLLFMVFLIPGTPKDAITYVAPYTKISLIKFLIITSIARIPSIVTSTISGDALVGQNYMLSVGVFVVTGIISLVGIVVYNKYIVR